MTVTYPTNATYLEDAITYSIANRKPDRGYSEDRIFDMAFFESQAGYESRRLRSRRAKRRYAITYTNINGYYMNAIRDFYNARFGNFEAFYLDLSYLNQSGTVTVRFDGPLVVNNILDGSTTDKKKLIYTVSFNLQEVYI